MSFNDEGESDRECEERLQTDHTNFNISLYGEIRGHSISAKHAEGRCADNDRCVRCGGRRQQDTLAFNVLVAWDFLSRKSLTGKAIYGFDGVRRTKGEGLTRLSKYRVSIKIRTF